MSKAKLVIGGVVVAAALLAGSAVMFIGSNDAGNRQVIQSPNGDLSVRFNSGWYWQGFDTIYTYPDTINYDTPDTIIVNQKTGIKEKKQGIQVQYQDGGMGYVDGSALINLPTDEASMIALHKAVKSPQGIINNIISREVRQGINLTAGLMTSEEAYAVRRNDYADWARQQIQYGRFDTVLENKTVKMEDGSFQTKQVPVIKYDKAGQPTYQDGMFADYNLQVTGFQITSWDFEDKTKAQIDKKREAEMAIITAKANADRAAWEQKEVEAKGKKAIAKVKYEQLQEKEKQVIIAERAKEVAILAAEQKVEVAEQLVAENKQKALAAKAEAESIETLSVANAEAKKRAMAADGALQQKLDAYVQAQQAWADAYARRAVPQLVMGGDKSNVNSDAAVFQQMLNAKLAKELLVNPNVTK